MLDIGNYQTLTIVREKPQGYYLECEEGDEVLLPQKYITEDMEIGDKIKVFIYCDTEDMDVATTEEPYLTVGQFAALEVMDVNDVGAFCDWGVIKQLFIPYRNQAKSLRPGQICVVYLYLDEHTDRLVGTTKLQKFLTHEAGKDIEEEQRVQLIVWAETDLGFKVIVNQKYAGLVYKTEIHRQLDIGQELIGYIKHVRKDGKMDVSLFPLTQIGIEPNAKLILEALGANDGFLPFTDKSDPELIREEFGISKKLFKKAIGNLYKQKLVLLKQDGIYKV